MDQQILERLILDRALGGLEPDVDELLKAYLKQNPDAAAEIPAYDEVVMDARTVLSSPASTPACSETLKPLVSAIPKTRKGVAIQFMKYAACAVAGIVFAYAFMSSPVADGTGSKVSSAPEPQERPAFVHVRSEMSDRSDRFWSVSNLVSVNERNEN